MVFDHIRWMVSYIWMVYVELQNHLNANWISFFFGKKASCQMLWCSFNLCYFIIIAVLRLVSCGIAFPLRTQLGAIDASCWHHTYFTRDDNVCDILTWNTHTHRYEHCCKCRFMEHVYAILFIDYCEVSPLSSARYICCSGFILLNETHNTPTMQWQTYTDNQNIITG